MHVLQGRGGALENEVVDADRRASRPPTVKPLVPDAAVRRCPSCNLDMGSLTVGRVRVDSCPAHGTWFDRLEVTRVTKELVTIANSARRRRAEAGLPSLADFVNDTKALAIGAVTIPMQLFEWLVEWANKNEHPHDCRCSQCVDERYERSRNVK